MRPLPPPWLGWVLAVLAPVLVVAGFVLVNLGGGAGFPVDVGFAPVVSMALAFPVVAAVIISQRPRHAMGWLYGGIGLTAGLTLATWGYAQYGIVTRPGALPGAVAAAMRSPRPRVSVERPSSRRSEARRRCSRRPMTWPSSATTSRSRSRSDRHRWP